MTVIITVPHFATRRPTHVNNHTARSLTAFKCNAPRNVFAPTTLIIAVIIIHRPFPSRHATPLSPCSCRMRWPFHRSPPQSLEPRIYRALAATLFISVAETICIEALLPCHRGRFLFSIPRRLRLQTLDNTLCIAGCSRYSHPTLGVRDP